MTGVSLLPYILVRPDSFDYVTVKSSKGEKTTLAQDINHSRTLLSTMGITHFDEFNYIMRDEK